MILIWKRMRNTHNVYLIYIDINYLFFLKYTTKALLYRIKFRKWQVIGNTNSGPALIISLLLGPF